MLEAFINIDIKKFLFNVLIPSYFFGSISFAVIISKIRGLEDPRKYGSNNPGATNVLRSGDKIAALLTLFGDSIKGLIVVLLIRHLILIEPLDYGDYFLLSGGMMGVFLGHLFPIFFKFQGGKGVATGGGILFGLDFFLGISSLCVWLATFCYFRVSALAALVSAFSVFIFSKIYLPISFPNAGSILIFTSWSISLLLILRHRENLVDFFNTK